MNLLVESPLFLFIGNCSSDDLNLHYFHNVSRLVNQLELTFDGFFEEWSGENLGLLV